MRRTITRVGLGSLALLIAWGVVMEVAAAAFRTNLDGIRPNWTTMQTRRCHVHDTWMRPRLAYDYRTPTPTAGLGPSFSQFAPRGRFDQLWDDYHTAETTQFPNAFPGYEWAAHWAFQWF